MKRNVYSPSCLSDCLLISSHSHKSKIGPYGSLCCKKKAEIKWALRRKWPCHVMMVMYLNYYKSKLMDMSLSNTDHVECNKQSLHLQSSQKQKFASSTTVVLKH